MQPDNILHFSLAQPRQYVRFYLLELQLLSLFLAYSQPLQAIYCADDLISSDINVI